MMSNTTGGKIPRRLNEKLETSLMPLDSELSLIDMDPRCNCDTLGVVSIEYDLDLTGYS